MMKKALVIGILALLACVAFAGARQETGPAVDYLKMNWNELVEAAKKEGSLVFYSWWGGEFFKKAGEDFQKKYGINTQVVIADHDAMDNKALAEKDKAVGTIDAMLVGGGAVKAFMDSGIFYGPVIDRIPHGKMLDPKLRKMQEGVETKGYLVPIYRNQTGLIYDPERVSNPPQTWDELVTWIKAHPKQFAFCDPSKGGTGHAFIQTVIVNLCGGDEKYIGDRELVNEKIANWNIAWKWFNDNEKLMTITASNVESLSRLNDGEVSMAVAWEDAGLQIDKGSLFKRAKLYVPKMGFPGGGDSGGVLKNAPHKAAGILFLAYLTEVEPQVEYCVIFGGIPGRTDVEVKDAMLSMDEVQKYSTDWLPAPYKIRYADDFVKLVLMQ